MRAVVDRIEGDYLVLELENNDMCDVPQKLIPNAKENDIINIEIVKSDDTTKKINDLMDKLFK